MPIEEFITEELGMKNHHSSMFIGSFQRQPDLISHFAGSLPAIQNTYRRLS
jgi:hypothetical protein